MLKSASRYYVHQSISKMLRKKLKIQSIKQYYALIKLFRALFITTESVTHCSQVVIFPCCSHFDLKQVPLMRSKFSSFKQVPTTILNDSANSFFISFSQHSFFWYCKCL